MTYRYTIIFVCAMAMTVAGYADNIDEMLDAEGQGVEAVMWSDVPEMVPLSDEVRPDDYAFHTSNEVMGYFPRGGFIPGTDDDFYIVSWATQSSSYSDSARAQVQKYSKTGQLLAGPVSVQDAGQGLIGKGFGWDIAVFSDGGYVTTGSVAGLLPGAPFNQFAFDTEIPGFRLFDSDMQPVTALANVFEPETSLGLDGARDDLSPNMVCRALILAGDRFVIAAAVGSVEMQKAMGLVDNDGNPGEKIYYRLFNRDGSPVGPTRMAFPTDDWGQGQSKVALCSTPDGGFAVTGTAAVLENGARDPIRIFDANGDPLGDAFSVIDQSLLDEGANSGKATTAISYGNGIFAHGTAVDLLGDSLTNEFCITLFDIDGTILRSTFDGYQCAYVNRARGRGMTSDPSGNLVIAERGNYSAPSPGDADEIVMRLILSDGTYFTPPFVPHDGMDGSQRDEFVMASDGAIVVGYLTEHGEDIAKCGFRVFANPMPQVPVNQWMLH